MLLVVTFDYYYPSVANQVPQNWYEGIYSLMNGFSMTLLLMSITLYSAQVSNIEHKNETWQLTETQPIPKWSIYYAKYIHVCIRTFITIALFLIVAHISFYIQYKIIGYESQVYFLEIEWRKGVLYLFNTFQY
jgi:hypothetical protein